VPEGDARAFSEAVALLLQDPARRSAMAQAASEHAATENDIAAAAAFLDEQLRRLAGTA